MLVRTLSTPSLTLEILPEVGASILNLRAASGTPVLRAVELESVKTSSQCASFTLVPYSNRIRDARFLFQGEWVGLRPTTPDGLAQHGDVRNRPWREAQAPAGPGEALRFEFESREFGDMNWPWAFNAWVEYRLHGPHCDMTLGLTNVDTRPMPAGLGFHPYFARRAGGVDPLLGFHAPLTYDTDERVLVTAAARSVTPSENFAQPRAIGDASLDRAFTAWDGVARLDWGTRALTLTADNVFSHLIAYTAPDGSLALEPVSHATDAFNLAAQGVPGVDLRVLESGQTLAGTARITLEGEW